MANKVKVIQDQAKFAEIAKRFEGARSDWQKFQQGLNHGLVRIACQMRQGLVERQETLQINAADTHE